MLFVFGVSIGSNKELVSNVGNIGLQAFILAFCGVAGSVLAASMAFSLFFKKKGGRHENNLMIVGCLLTGILCGMYLDIPFLPYCKDISSYLLAFLVFRQA